MGDTPRDDGTALVAGGRKPLPRNGDVRPVEEVGLWPRDGPILNSLMMANEDFLCGRGWLILRNRLERIHGNSYP